MRDAKYFPSQERAKHIQRMIRFLGDTEPMMLIIGDRGTGKSTLIQAFTELGHTPTHTLKLIGQPTLEPNRLARLIHKHWQLGEQKANTTKRDQFDFILTAMGVLHQPGLLLIDEAHKLPFSTLAALMHMALSQTQGDIKLRILLLGTSQLVDSLDNLHNPNLYIPRITLQPFNMDETQHYITHILSKLGLTSEHHPSTAFIQKIYQKSQGIPSMVYRLTQDFFEKQPKPEPPQKHVEQPSSPSITARFFERHWIKAACMGMLAFTFLGIHQYQLRVQQMQTIASKTYSAPLLAKAQENLINPPQVLAKKQHTPAAFNGYTIQLMGSNNIEKVLAYNKAHKLEKKTHIQLEQRQGKNWYTLDLGEYTNSHAAHQALAALPKNLSHNPQQGNAWVKHFS